MGSGQEETLRELKSENNLGDGILGAMRQHMPAETFPSVLPGSGSPPRRAGPRHRDGREASMWGSRRVTEPQAPATLQL